MKLNNQVYDVLKYVVQIGLPALATFIMAVGPVWGLPRTDDVVTTIVAFNALLGALILVSRVQYARKQPAEE